MSDTSNSEQGTQRGFEDYWALIKRRRSWLLWFTFAGWALAIVAGYVLPPKYKSETVILVDQSKVPSQYVTPNVAVDLQSQLQSLTEQILSRTRLLGIIDDFHLYASARKKGEDAAVMAMKRDIVIDEVKHLDRPGELTGFKVSYSAPNPKLARDVTGRMASLFIEENLRNQQQQSEDTNNFLQSQLEEARADLEKQEKELETYRSAHLGQLPEQTQSNMQILAGLQERLRGATEALNHAEQQKLYLESLLGQYNGSRVPISRPGSGATSVSSSPRAIQQQLETLRSQLAELNTKYTPSYPDVIRVKKQIAELEAHLEHLEQQSSAADSQQPVAVSATLETDPAVLQLQSEAKANALEIGNRRKEVEELDQQIERYQSRLNVAPAREQQLAEITRNYRQSQTNYESLLAKKMQSQMATNLEKRQEGTQFRVLDPPSLPEKPFSPDRFKFAMGGLAIGLGLGVIASILTELLYGRIYSERDLVEIAGTAVLAIVPPLPTTRELRARGRRRTMEFVFAGLMLLIIPAVTFLTYLKG